MKSIITISLVIIIATASLMFESAYKLNENNYAVITQTGKPVKIASNAGWHFKIPFLQQVHFVPNTLVLKEDTFQPQTKDNKTIDVQSRTQWKIVNPILFYENFPSFSDAGLSVAGPVTHKLVEVFRETPFKKIKECPTISTETYCDLEIHSSDIKQDINYVLNQWGIKVVHVGIKVKLSTADETTIKL